VVRFEGGGRYPARYANQGLIKASGRLLDRPAALDDTDQNDDEGHNEQDVNESSQCVGSDESQEPENQ
jgi:hypothetical protein